MRNAIEACVVASIVAGGMTAFSAQVPLPKPPRPPEKLTSQGIDGKWIIDWAGIRAPAWFTKDGGYCCVFEGVLWTGSWRFDDSGGIEVREKRPEDAEELTWRVSGEQKPGRAGGHAVGTWGKVPFEMRKEPLFSPPTPKRRGGERQNE
jgi:hypothetical protein